MILQALNDYYQRKPELPRAGFEMKEIPFVIELAKDGSVVQIEDTRTLEGKKKRARSFLVPQGAKKSVNVAANLLWGNAEYVLGLPDSKKLDERKSKNREAEYRERIKEMHAAFVGELSGLPPDSLRDTGVTAVLKFCANVPLDELTRFGGLWKEIQASNPSLTFRLQGEVDLVCQRQAVVAAVRDAADVAQNEAVCLVSGESDEIERLHAPIKGVWGAQTSGANIVSFNLDAFNSWGKMQGANAPVGKRAAFAYTTALNHLLAKDSRQRIQVGDASTVFWADHPSVLEDAFADIFLEPPKDDPDRNTRALRALFEAPAQGVPPIKDEQTRFFVLGLAPNAARAAVRFWHVGTVADMSANIDRHFRDLDIVYAPFERPHLSLFRLLASIAVQGKSENILPNLGGEVMRAVLAGRAYPETLLQGALRRIRAEREVNYPRAALVKACINRQSLSRVNPEKELTVSLDLTNANPGYRLGRLFAVLEKIQEEANPGINATIRDRFYGAASAMPVTVFPNLMKLKNHHFSKLENTGRRVNLERLITDIMDSVSDFPSHMSLADQGRFAIGYYHQRHALFSKPKGTN
jgi:CRISPR-associated protein Csd1